MDRTDPILLSDHKYDSFLFEGETAIEHLFENIIILSPYLARSNNNDILLVH